MTPEPRTGRAAPLWVRAAAAVIRRLPAGRYRAAHWVGRRARAPFWAELPPDLGSLQFHCDLHDGLMREACLTGRYEPQETTVFRHLLRPGMTLVDVGANWGYFTLVGAHLVGPTGRVISVEADARAARAVRANVARNGLTWVRLFDVAASDATRELRFDSYERGASDAGHFGLAETRDEAPSAGTVAVRGRPLDDLLDDARIERVDLLKMDIEGGEAAALAGAHRRLASGRIDRIVLELHPPALQRLGSSAEAVVALLRGYGYDARRIDHSRDSHRRAAAGDLPLDALLSSLDASGDLGVWPHLLCQRPGLSC